MRIIVVTFFDYARHLKSRHILLHSLDVDEPIPSQALRNVSGALASETESRCDGLPLREQSEQTVQNILVKSGLAGSISLIPFGVGSAINEMLTQLALRRTHERMEALFDEMAKHIHHLGKGKINRDWFHGEEFQTLLFEALHQLHLTRDKYKIKMLGKALANSGATEFKDESRKELFLQLIRDLTPQHVAWLRQLSPTAKNRPDMPEGQMAW